MKKLYLALLMLFAVEASAQVLINPGGGSGGGGTSGGSAITNCTTAGAVLYMDASALLACGGSPAPSYDATSILLKVGTGSTTQQGWYLGYSTISGTSEMWTTGVTPSVTNYVFSATSTATSLNASANPFLNLANTTKAGISSTGGSGWTITAGTATTDVQSLSTTQTWNAAGITFTGHKYTVTDTASAAGSLHSGWYGGAAGTTALMTLSKDGNVALSGVTGWIQNSAGEVALNANYTNATATFSPTTLSVTVISGRTYSFSMNLTFDDSTAADGAQFDFNGGSAAATNFRVQCTASNATGAALVLTNAGTTALATAVQVALALTTQAGIRCDGTFVPSGNGTFIVRAAQTAHTTGTLTVHRGSWLSLKDARPL